MSGRKVFTYEEHTILPNAEETESILKRHDLEVLKRQYDREWPFVSTQTKFNYSWGLVKSKIRSEQQEGVKLLFEIYRESPERRRECLYYLALGLYKLKNYTEARRYNDLLLEKEPENIQALNLQILINKSVTKEGYVGMAIVGSLLAMGGLALGAWARWRR
ncbi:hypothetical protein T552_00711 [Pneumocystis carinii B80]|uniref:Mitochondrial fission 1 protein n=1 Tax=Pneumocystis carinii (strain B80) TaxID=1408658 RepID=A0A0W4ZPB7_PNEC8|nr:hypothetical protein T552_00711 [Pneumocystis carinii B80]KTW30233.1 hypothetical protein T552_00711 [Pneumocystis carinii B80]